MPEPTTALQALRASTADLVQGLEAQQWSDDDVRGPSLCAGWTRAHVLTHLARNADGIAATLAGALRGEVVPRYPDGWDARNAAIDEGAARPLAAQVADVAESAERLDRVFGAVAEAEAWSARTDQGRAAQDWVFWRLREVEIHRVDLAGDYLPDRWPPLLIAELLPAVADTLPERVTGRVRVEIDADASIAPEFAGRVWTAGDGAMAEVEVRGPDWAVLAWLVGRGSAAQASLTATPDLADWR